MGNEAWVGWLCSAGQVGGCRRPLPGCPRPEWEDTWGRKKETGKALPNIQALVRGDGAKDSLWVNELSSGGNWGFSFVKSTH